MKPMKKDENYILPDHAAERRRSRNAAETAFFEMGEQNRMAGLHKKYYIRTYGCQANVRDGETMAGMLEMMGFEKTEDLQEADVLLFNTCAVRQAAEERVLGEIGSLKPMILAHPEKIIGLCGCMAQEETIVRRVLQKYPQVKLIFGTHNIHRLPDLLSQVMHTGNRMVEVLSEEGKIVENLPAKRTQQYKAFVNIMYGCNKFCTYCIVPYTRGKERSRTRQDILREIRDLQENGCREAVLLGQNVNAYGKDLNETDGFTALLRDCARTGIDRIRFYTSHPRDYSSATIDVMREYPNIMPSLHLPVQSGSDAILKRMNRGYTAESYMRLYDEMKEKIPGITFTTDLIVGFPDESDEDFEDTLKLVDYCRFDLAYSFIYSPREGTPAASMPDSIPMEVKKERLQILNSRLAQYANENNQRFKGQVLEVLCEGSSKKNDDVYSGYSRENKLVNFRADRNPEGELVNVEITDIHSFSLDGKAL